MSNVIHMPGMGDYESFPMTGLIDPRYDYERDADREERIQVIAAFYWDRDMGEPPRADRLHEAMSEVLGCMDEAEIGELGRMASKRPEELGPWLVAKAAEWLQAECLERAREEVEREELRDEAEAAMARMGG